MVSAIFCGFAFISITVPSVLHFCVVPLQLCTSSVLNVFFVVISDEYYEIIIYYVFLYVNANFEKRATYRKIFYEPIAILKKSDKM